MDVGILLSRDEGEDHSAEVTHWVVSIDGASEEEVVSEKVLGRVLDDVVDQSDSSTIEKSAKEKTVKKKTTTTKFKNKKRKGGRFTRTSGNSGEDESLLNDGAAESPPQPNAKPSKQDGDETVVEVKMLTGTLFIYRGENHWVEFVRTV